MATTLMSFTPPRCGPTLVDNMTRKLPSKDNDDEEKIHECDRQTQPQVQHVQPTPDTQESVRVHRRKSKYDRALVGRYKLIKTIGTGNFAKVKLAEHLLTGKEVAIKIIDKTDLSSSSRRKLSREVRLMKVLNHPNIVRLLEIIDTEKIMYLVMEYEKGANKIFTLIRIIPTFICLQPVLAQGELYEYLFDNGRMTEKLAREKFRQILSAVQYCHQKRIVHRDLKTENLLLDADLNIKLADFGFANEFHEGTKLNTFCGSPPYAAPELFRGKEYDGPEVDVWSLGVILFKLVSGALPFDGRSLSELRDRVLRGRYRIPFYMSTECEKLLKKMLVVNPVKRHSVEAIMKDPWVNIGYADDPLVPYVEPKPDFTDPSRISAMMNMGFSLDAILSSLKNGHFDEITATYHLLENKETKFNTEEHATRSIDVSIDNSPSRTDDAHENWLTAPKKADKNQTDSPHKSVPKIVGNIIIENQTPRRDDTSVNDGRVSKEPLPDTLVGAKQEKVFLIQMTPDKNVTLIDAQKTKDNRDSENLIENSTTKLESPHSPQKSSAVHWYPTAGIAIQNGKVSVRDIKAGQQLREKENSSTLSQISDKIEIGAEKVTEKSPNDGEKRNPDVSVRLHTDENNVETLDPLELQLREKSRRRFSRLDPVRQTVHCTNRPHVEQQLYDKYSTPGMGENKTTAVAAPRTNLSSLESDTSDRYDLPLKDSNKSKGFFRSFTLRFSRRSRPLLDKSDAGYEREHQLSHIHTHFEDQRHEYADVTVNNSSKPLSVRIRAKQAVRPSSQISSGSKRISRELELSRAFTPVVGNGPLNPGGHIETESTDNSPVGFFRSLALRFSKRKPCESGHLLDSLDMKKSTEDGSSVARRQESLSNLPLSILASVGDRARTFGDQNFGGASDPSFMESKLHSEVRPFSYSMRASESQEKPRVMRFKWNMKITTKMQPEEIVTEIIKVLRNNNFSYEQQRKFVFLCETYNRNLHGCLSWEMEVCESPRMGLNGVRFHKISGTTSEFKSIVNKITQQLKL
ncbi:Serine/threonine-protein kinase MARK2 [Fasciola gigantica]|uniref:non-specific serine/threonine protein kinase n=1 Tax=Fasciola gigantica TaxID=46835 RepID=A0A504Z224_FASGI|nr:Serine/threonine-protein kinase MARK2 [Fasciola gigantica]